MENKSSIFKQEYKKNFNNNRKIFYASKDQNMNSRSNIIKKIQDIVNAPNFIYYSTVNILVGNDLIKRKIIGINNNNLVTIDNEYIPINNIHDIYI